MAPEILRKKILVVDDERKMCATMKKILQGAGYEVEVAFNGMEAIDQFERFTPDCVLLDLRMPRTNGQEVLNKIKDLRPETQVLITTAVIDADCEKQCLHAGAVNYLLKPINFSRLLNRLGNALNGPVAEAAAAPASPPPPSPPMA